jgi:hypothetical protein
VEEHEALEAAADSAHPSFLSHERVPLAHGVLKPFCHFLDVNLSRAFCRSVRWKGLKVQTCMEVIDHSIRCHVV